MLEPQTCLADLCEEATQLGSVDVAALILVPRLCVIRFRVLGMGLWA